MKKVLIFIVIVLVVIGGFFIFKHYNNDTFYKSQVIKEGINPDQSLKGKVERYLFDKLNSSKQPGGGSSEFSIAERKACSFLLYGNDSKYIYGYVACQFISWRDDTLKNNLYIFNEINDVIRLTYIGSDFKITGYEIPTGQFKDDNGTHNDDILPLIYLNDYSKNWDNNYMLLEKENIKKILKNSPLTKDIAIFLATEYDHYNSDPNSKNNSLKLGAYPNGKADAIGNEKDGWNVVLYMNYSESGPVITDTRNNINSFMASCYSVATDISVKLTGEYLPPKETPIKNIDPKTCLIK